MKASNKHIIEHIIYAIIFGVAFIFFATHTYIYGRAILIGALFFFALHIHEAVAHYRNR